MLGFSGPQIVPVTDVHHSDVFVVFVPFGGFKCKYLTNRLICLSVLSLYLQTGGGDKLCVGLMSDPVSVNWQTAAGAGQLWRRQQRPESELQEEEIPRVEESAILSFWDYRVDLSSLKVYCKVL